MWDKLWAWQESHIFSFSPDIWWWYLMEGLEGWKTQDPTSLNETPRGIWEGCVQKMDGGRGMETGITSYLEAALLQQWGPCPRPSYRINLQAESENAQENQGWDWSLKQGLGMIPMIVWFIIRNIYLVFMLFLAQSS